MHETLDGCHLVRLAVGAPLVPDAEGQVRLGPLTLQVVDPQKPRDVLRAAHIRPCRLAPVEAHVDAQHRGVRLRPVAVADEVPGLAGVVRELDVAVVAAVAADQTEAIGGVRVRVALTHLANAAHTGVDLLHDAAVAVVEAGPAYGHALAALHVAVVPEAARADAAIGDGGTHGVLDGAAAVSVRAARLREPREPAALLEVRHPVGGALTGAVRADGAFGVGVAVPVDAALAAEPGRRAARLAGAAQQARSAHTAARAALGVGQQVRALRVLGGTARPARGPTAGWAGRTAAARLTRPRTGQPEPARSAPTRTPSPRASPARPEPRRAAWSAR